MSRSVPGYYPVSGKAPDGGGTWQFLVSISRLQDLERHGPTSVFYDARLIPATLAVPTAIFQGLEREGFEDAYCYCGVPAGRWISSSIELPPRPGMTFLVYAKSDHRGHVILDWEWRPMHPDRAGYPIDYQTDFGRQIWPKTS